MDTQQLIMFLPQHTQAHVLLPNPFLQLLNLTHPRYKLRIFNFNLDMQLF